MVILKTSPLLDSTLVHSNAVCLAFVVVHEGRRSELGLWVSRDFYESLDLKGNESFDLILSLVEDTQKKGEK